MVYVWSIKSIIATLAIATPFVIGDFFAIGIFVIKIAVAG